MNIKPLKSVTLVAGAVAAMASASALAQTTIYGLIDIGYGVNEGVTGKGSKADFHSGGDNDSSELNSTTRVGVKGSYDLGSGIKGNFKFETAGITSDGKVGSVDGTRFFNRQAWAGLSGGFGEVRLGRMDSIARIASAPSTASPNAQYCPSSRAVSSRVRATNHWLPALSGQSLRAIETTPKSCGSADGSSMMSYPGPPSPVPVGSPPWITNGRPPRPFGTTRWTIVPS